VNEEALAHWGAVAPKKIVEQQINTQPGLNPITAELQNI